MWASFPFFASLILLGAFAGFHSWETKRRIRLYKETRELWDRRIMHAYDAAVSGNIPKEWRIAVFAFSHAITHAVVVFLVDTLNAIERPLAQLSHRMRMRAPSINAGKDVSPFLKTLSPDKKEDTGTAPESGI